MRRIEAESSLHHGKDRAHDQGHTWKVSAEAKVFPEDHLCLPVKPDCPEPTHPEAALPRQTR
ncbi:hypothetical protein COMA2_180082 [Candidatus Nitrospira nitrificans]|uniref:Uncharacterized protein n=1 Tax=Candidatus Nitrospira nitrificans TaxID=1742973 RepID=A0A0S4LA82_9BACT|nr:hypothetical protein COMA2_180082 [Candidatus Nitrospira nitrificans]